MEKDEILSLDDDLREHFIFVDVDMLMTEIDCPVNTEEDVEIANQA